MTFIDILSTSESVVKSFKGNYLIKFKPSTLQKKATLKYFAQEYFWGRQLPPRPFASYSLDEVVLLSNL